MMIVRLLTVMLLLLYQPVFGDELPTPAGKSLSEFSCKIEFRHPDIMMCVRV